MEKGKNKSKRRIWIIVIIIILILLLLLAIIKGMLCHQKFEKPARIYPSDRYYYGVRPIHIDSYVAYFILFFDWPPNSHALTAAWENKKDEIYSIIQTNVSPKIKDKTTLKDLEGFLIELQEKINNTLTAGKIKEIQLTLEITTT